MAEMSFKCPHCGQDLHGPEDLAGQFIDCPSCEKNFEVPGGIIEVPREQLAPPVSPSPVTNAETTSIPPPTDDSDKGKTVRIELPPEVLADPKKHIFKIKRIQR
ncbi:MAG: hypothetical protein GX803_01485 [Lentisphaerae bacterium]|jgi:hypothetical protein|nr:hypothetical protein [Lentisphaerota bacterium]